MSYRKPCCGNRGGNAQKGVGLIEVMVTLLILTISLLAMAGLQNRSLQFNHGAYLRSQANILAYDMLDRMRINRDNFNAYERDFEDNVPVGGSLAAQDVSDWLQLVQSTLPNGQGAIECDVNRVCTLRLRWFEENRESGVEDDQDEAQTQAEFVYATQL